MSLAKDLLQQAEHLATKERKKPRQASLRRAVSDAYYALFHLLVEDCCRQLITGADAQALRDQVARAFVHAEMQRTSKAFASAGLAPAVQACLGGPLPREVQLVAAAFVELQEARHEADYNLAKRLTRTETLDLIQRSSQAFQNWTIARVTLAVRTYLVSLLLGKQWSR